MKKYVIDNVPLIKVKHFTYLLVALALLMPQLFTPTLLFDETEKYIAAVKGSSCLNICHKLFFLPLCALTLIFDPYEGKKSVGTLCSS